MENTQQTLINKLNEKFGDDLFVNNAINKEIECITSGSKAVDRILGINGIPKKKITEFFGSESSGKTTLALMFAHEVIKNNQMVVYLDFECSIDNKYLSRLNIPSEKILLIQPKSGEQAFDIIETLLKDKNVGLIVVDSVAAMMPAQEMELTLDDQTIGIHARLMSRGLRKIQPILNNSDAALIFINQIRDKIGNFYANNETTTGGRALRFYASIRLEIKKYEIIKNNNEKIGIRSKITVVKNKLAAPYLWDYIDFYFDTGFDPTIDLISSAISNKIILKKSGWYYFQDEKLAQGLFKTKKYLEENNEILNKINELLSSNK